MPTWRSSPSRRRLAETTSQRSSFGRSSSTVNSPPSVDACATGVPLSSPPDEYTSFLEADDERSRPFRARRLRVDCPRIRRAATSAPAWRLDFVVRLRGGAPRLRPGHVRRDGSAEPRRPLSTYWPACCGSPAWMAGGVSAHSSARSRQAGQYRRRIRPIRSSSPLEEPVCPCAASAC